MAKMPPQFKRKADGDAKPKGNPFANGGNPFAKDVDPAERKRILAGEIAAENGKGDKGGKGKGKGGKNPNLAPPFKKKNA